MWTLLKVNKHLKFMNTYCKEICLKALTLWSCRSFDFLNAAFIVGFCFTIWTQLVSWFPKQNAWCFLSKQYSHVVVFLCGSRFQLQCYVYYVCLVFLDFLLLNFFMCVVVSCSVFHFSHSFLFSCGLSLRYTKEKQVRNLSM